MVHFFGAKSKSARNRLRSSKEKRRKAQGLIRGYVRLGVESLEPRWLLSSLGINVNQVLRPVNDHLLGVNVPSWDGLVGTGVTPDAQTVQKVREAGLQIVRLSNGDGNDGSRENLGGGNFIQHDGWHWSSPVNAFPVGAALLGNLIAQADADAVIDLNYGTGTPTEAAAYVAYLNGSTSNTFVLGIDEKGTDWKTVAYWATLRSQSALANGDGLDFLRAGHPEPFGFRYFEVGNEAYYGIWQGATPDPADYIAFAKEFESMARYADPSISVGIGIGPAVDWDNAWNIPVLQASAAQGFTPGFLSDHFYVYNGLNNNGDDYLTDSDLLLHTVNEVGSIDPYGTPINWADRFEAYRLLLETYLPGHFLGSGPGQVELLCTELNSDVAAANQQSVSLVRGLFLADALGGALQTDYSAAIYWDLRNGYTSSAYNPDGLYGWRLGSDQGLLGSSGPAPQTGPYTPYPQYFAEQLASKLIRSGGEVVGAVSDDPLISVYSVRQQDGTLTLMVINKSDVNNDGALIGLSGYVPSSQADLFRYGIDEDNNQAFSGDGAASLTQDNPNLQVSHYGMDSNFTFTFPAYSMTVLELTPAFPLVVTTADDELDAIPDPTDLSLREAIALANEGLGADTITFAPALAGQPILPVGPMIITDSVTIQGLGAGQTTVNGQNNFFRLFDITSVAGAVTFDGLTLTGGLTTSNNENGGAIRSMSSPLTIQNSIVSGNSTTGFGSNGGAIYAPFALVSITNSTISGNSTAGFGALGGGISAYAVTLSNSTVSGNFTTGENARGGGIQSSVATLTNSTISGNSTIGNNAHGGGIYTNSPLTVINSTITQNSVGGLHANGGGIGDVNGPVVIRNSIVAGNSDADGSHPNLQQVTGLQTIQFSMMSGNPMLGPLTNNGGPTRTHRPLTGSPVIDAGSNSLAVDPVSAAALTSDQRGAPFVRIADGPDADSTATVDMGAFELAPVPFALVVTTADDELDSINDAADLSLREAIALANASLGADTITFAAALAWQPILLALGQMTISDPLTIQGLVAGQTTINGQNSSRLFDITSAAGAVTFDRLTLTGGKTTANNQFGGAIWSRTLGQLTIQNSTIAGNSTVGINSKGGGIVAMGPVTVTGSTISGNSTMGSLATGGGVYSNLSLTVTNSTISGNSTAQAHGGGIYARGSATINNSTITGNSVAGNFADGGGVFAYSYYSYAYGITTTPMTFRNSIVAGNSDTSGGSFPDLRPGGPLTVRSSLIGDNTGTVLVKAKPGPDINGNKIGGTNDVIDPLLGPLQNNGGTTFTQALQPGSPALNAGNNTFVNDLTLTTDQRGIGFPRINFAVVDMGAVEYSAPPVIASFGGDVTYIENAAPTRVATTATVSDSDSTNFDNGQLVARLTANAEAADRLSIVTLFNVSTNGDQVLYSGTAIGTFAGGLDGAALTIDFNAQATASGIGAVLRNLAFSSTSDNPSAAPRTLTVFLTDGDGGASLAQTKQIAVTPKNDGPAIGNFGGNLAYTENGAWLLVTTTATVVDVDSTNFDTGKLTVKFTVNGQSTDRLTVQNQGNANDEISTIVTDATTNTGTVSYTSLLNGVLMTQQIGSFTGGIGTTSLVITLNANATPIRVQALLRNITYQNVSNAPVGNSRTVWSQLTDGDTGTSVAVTKQIVVTPVNDDPLVYQFGVNPAFNENGNPLLLTTTATVIDGDSTDFSAGKLTVQFTANGESTDRLAIRNQGTANGQISTTITNAGVNAGKVFHTSLIGGVLTTVEFGSFTGGIGTTPLVVSLNTSSTPVRTQALLRNVTYQSISDNPSANARTVSATLTDGDGGTGGPVSKQIAVTPSNDVPVIGNFGDNVAYTENAVPRLLTATATVNDLDSANFDTGKLTAKFTANGQSTDRLTIRNQGTANGQIGVTINDVATNTGTVSHTSLINGVLTTLEIGSFTGGIGTIPLVITLNANATPVRVQSLLRNITYHSISDNPSANSRTVWAQVTDGGGGTSAAVTKQIAITPTNDAPVIGTFGGNLAFIENGLPLLITTTATVTDVDSVDLNAGQLTVNFTANGQSADRLTIRNQGTANGQISRTINDASTNTGTVSHTSLINGVLTTLEIGSFTGGLGTTPLVITLNAAATPGRVQALLRNITYQNISDVPSANTRTVFAQLTDGVGGTSAAVTKQIAVTPVSDAPAGTDKTVTTPENTAYTFTVADFGFTDPNDSPVNAIQSVKITTLPTNGSLLNNGVVVAAGQTLPIADISGAKLKFTLGVNASGASYDSFTFQVQDNGNLANGGVTLDPSANLMTIDVIGKVSDNSDPSFVIVSGTWPTANGGYLSTIRSNSAGTGQDVARWTFANLTPGQYRVSATWVSAASRATNAPFTVLDGNLPFTPVLVSQQSPPQPDVLIGSIKFQDLGTYDIAGTTLVVTLSDNADGLVVADAIRIERLGDLPSQSGQSSVAAEDTYDSRGALFLTQPDPVPMVAAGSGVGNHSKLANQAAALNRDEVTNISNAGIQTIADQELRRRKSHLDALAVVMSELGQVPD